MSRYRKKVGRKAYENVRRGLREAFPDDAETAEITDKMVDESIIAMWQNWDERYEGLIPPPSKKFRSKRGKHKPDASGVVGYYLTHATHRRSKAGETVHEFVGHLPMAHVVLPQSENVAVKTAIGRVNRRGALYGSVDALNRRLRNEPGFHSVGHAELITPPRVNGERFAAVAVYLLYTDKSDARPSAYLMEAGLAQGGPRVPYYCADIDGRIDNVFAGYAPTAFSNAEFRYEAWIEVHNRRLTRFHVRVRTKVGADVHMSVDADLENCDNDPPSNHPTLIRLGAAGRISLIGEALGVPLKGIEGKLDGLGRSQAWNKVPEVDDE